MKDRVYIFAEIFSETQRQFPHINMRKFELLFCGWRQQGIRHGRNYQFYWIAWKRGWLAEKDADDLRKYIGLV